MDFTLRQARNLENRLRNISIDGQVIEVRAYDSEVSRSDIEAGVKKLDEAIDNSLEINEIRHEIKNNINMANMECGVSSLLNTRDMLYAKRDILNTLGQSDDVERQISHISNSPKAVRMACVYTEGMEDQVSEDLADIDHQLNEISKELHTLNNSVTVTLSEDDVELLKEHGYL